MLALFISARPADAQEGWQTLVDGIGYREFSLPGPNRAYVARLDRSHQELIIDSGIALGELGAGKETVSDMAARYDQAMNAWGGTWGSRNQVVVAINGSFYNTRTGVPESGVVHSGAYTKWYGSLQGGSGFAWTLDRQAFIGQCVYHRPEKQVLTYLASGATQLIDGVDVKGEENDLIVITPDADLPALGWRPPAQHAGGDGAPSAHPAVAGHGTRDDPRAPRQLPCPPAWPSIRWSSRPPGPPASSCEAQARPGDRIGISLEITDLGPDCSTWQNLDWTKTYAGVGGSFDFLLDGELQSFDNVGATARHPRRRCVSTTTGSTSSSSTDGIPGAASA